jgi:hypothetical protein
MKIGDNEDDVDDLGRLLLLLYSMGDPEAVRLVQTQLVCHR